MKLPLASDTSVVLGAMQSSVAACPTTTVIILAAPLVPLLLPATGSPSAVELVAEATALTRPPLLRMVPGLVGPLKRTV